MGAAHSATTGLATPVFFIWATSPRSKFLVSVKYTIGYKIHWCCVVGIQSSSLFCCGDPLQVFVPPRLILFHHFEEVWLPPSTNVIEPHYSLPKFFQLSSLFLFYMMNRLKNIFFVCTPYKFGWLSGCLQVLRAASVGPWHVAKSIMRVQPNRLLPSFLSKLVLSSSNSVPSLCWKIWLVLHLSYLRPPGRDDSWQEFCAM